jgi:hypothetical protein
MGNHTANRRFLVLLEVIVHEAHYKRRLKGSSASSSHRMPKSVNQIDPLTLPTAASPSNTNLTLLLGFGPVFPDSAILWMCASGRDVGSRSSLAHEKLGWEEVKLRASGIGSVVRAGELASSEQRG